MLKCIVKCIVKDLRVISEMFTFGVKTTFNPTLTDNRSRCYQGRLIQRSARLRPPEQPVFVDRASNADRSSPITHQSGATVGYILCGGGGAGCLPVCLTLFLYHVFS